MIRAHWAIENSFHWVMDMVFRDDECRIRTEHAPANFATFRHMAHNLIRKAPGKDSLRLRRKTAGWDDSYLASLITSERIRDKIATSKRKGLWVGGTLPLGYHMKDDKILSLRTRPNASG